MDFVVDTGETPASVTAGPSGQIDHRGTYATHEIELHDARGEDLSIDREGFRLIADATAVADFHDPDEVRRVYYPELERLLIAETGARRVHLFDHTVRTGDEGEQADKALREPLGVAHNDYTDVSGPNRLRLALPEEAEALAARRFAIVQVWRPTHDVIRRRPLALCDARSVRQDDLLVTERRHRDRVGYTYSLLFHPGQRWRWFPEMTRDEAIVFKVYDADASRARFTPHASPALCAPPPDAGPRRSIEARALVFF